MRWYSRRAGCWFLGAVALLVVAVGCELDQPPDVQPPDGGDPGDPPRLPDPPAAPEPPVVSARYAAYPEQCRASPTGVARIAPDAPANDTVYFVGNSFTAGENVPRMVGTILQSLGKAVTVRSFTRGGYTLRQHLAVTGADGPREYIRRERPAVVVLQEQSSYPVRSETAFRGAVDDFARLVQSYGGRVLLYATWHINQSHEYTAEELYTAYSGAARESYTYIAPVGTAWAQYESDRSLAAFSLQAQEGLYSSDKHHANVIGAYLAAAVIASDVLGASVAGGNADAVRAALGDDADDDIALLQRIASEVCKADRLCGFEADIDGDGRFDFGANPDNCRYIANAAQTDGDGNGVGDACDGGHVGGVDTDGDGVPMSRDRCEDGARGWRSTPDTDGDRDGCRDSDEDYDDDNDRLVEISDIEGLNAVRGALNVSQLADRGGCPADGCRGYELTRDLDFSARDSYRGTTANRAYRTGEGWEPIGFTVSQGERFGLLFNGNGHTIHNLYINRPSGDNVGLFAALNDSAVVCNVILDNVDIIGRDYSGGLTGSVGATDSGGALVYGVGVTGAVTGKQYVGGLAGINGGEIRSSYSHADVRSTHPTNSLPSDRSFYDNAYAGGLVGQNDGPSNASFSNGIVRHSYATGSVTALSSMVGGLIGDAELGVVEDSYATGAVRSGVTLITYESIGLTARIAYVGGLIGKASANNIARVFSTGRVSVNETTDVDAIQYIGGLFGTRDDVYPDPVFTPRGVTTAAYWNRVSSGIAAGNGVGQFVSQYDSSWPKAVTDQQLQDGANPIFQGWDERGWNLGDMETNGHPTLLPPTVGE